MLVLFIQELTAAQFKFSSQGIIKGLNHLHRIQSNQLLLGVESLPLFELVERLQQGLFDRFAKCITQAPQVVSAVLNHLPLPLFIGLNKFQMAQQFIDGQRRGEKSVQRSNGGMAGNIQRCQTFVEHGPHVAVPFSKPRLLLPVQRGLPRGEGTKFAFHL